MQGEKRRNTFLDLGNRWTVVSFTLHPGIHSIEGWVGPRASVDDVGGEIISLPLPGFEARTVQSVATYCTD